MLFSLKSILELSKSKPSRKLVVVAAEDISVLMAVKKATFEGIIQPILIGKLNEILSLAKSIDFNITSIETIDIPDNTLASKTAVSLIQKGKADILMKGILSTAVLLKTVVNKESGLTQGNLLSHFAITELPAYHKLLALTDVAMNIKPDFIEKIDILKNAIKVMYALGYTMPKVAVISPLETINPKIESSIHAAMLTMMNRRNQIMDCLIDGPLALDNAINKEAAHHKGISSDVAGDADLLLLPDLDTGNVLYKSLNFLAKATTAAIITGAKVPIVLTSRADSELSKLYSIALSVSV
jgi:phosphate butyryltransferase